MRGDKEGVAGGSRGRFERPEGVEGGDGLSLIPTAHCGGGFSDGDPAGGVMGAFRPNKKSCGQCPVLIRQ